MFRSKVPPKKSFIIGDPKDRTHSLDNAIRIAASKYKLDRNKKYVITLTPNSDTASLTKKYDKIFYPAIIDETLLEDEILLTESMMKYLEYRKNQTITVEITEVLRENTKYADHCHFKVVKLSPNYSEKIQFDKNRLQEIILSTLSNQYLLSSGQLIYVEYQISYHTYKIELQLEIPGSDKQASMTFFVPSAKSMMTFSITPAIRNLDISKTAVLQQSDKNPSSTVERNTSNSSKSRNKDELFTTDETLPPIESLDKLLNTKNELGTPLPNNLSLDFKKMGIGQPFPLSIFEIFFERYVMSK